MVKAKSVETELADELLEAAYKHFGDWIKGDIRRSEKTVKFSFHGMPFTAKAYGNGDQDAYALMIWYSADPRQKLWVDYQSKDFTPGRPSRTRVNIGYQTYLFVRGVKSRDTKDWPEGV